MAETITTDNKSTLLYRFLVSPELRWARYLVLIMVLATISFNQVFIIFLDYRDILGGWIYTFTFLYLLTYIGVIYLNLFWLFPKFFAEKTLSKLHILTFSSNDACSGNTNGNGICILFLLAGILRTCLLFFHTYSDGLYIFFHVVHTLHDRRNNDCSPERMDDRPSTCLTNGKGSRTFGSGTAKRTSQPRTSFQNITSFGELTLSEPEKASKMLMKLSQLLRYQLYDCSRTKVLLSSEINFLNNYLTLEQNSQAQFNYELLADGEVNRTLVPPLLFIPFVQYIVKSINEQRTSIPVSLKIHLKVEENTIIFTCLCLQVNLLEDKGLERIRQRLNLLYGNRYRLFLTTESIWLELKGGEV